MLLNRIKRFLEEEEIVENEQYSFVKNNNSGDHLQNDQKLQ